MKSNPLISVLMPVRNEASLLFGCIEDILSQTLSEIELVIVDDGSTDTTAEVLKEASQRDSRIHVIHTKPKGIISYRHQHGN